MNIYKVQMYIEGTEDDAISLRKSLAQSVSDEFELNRVFGVDVVSDSPQENLVMALCMVELEDGFDDTQINRLMTILPMGKYMPIEFHANNTSAYGFVNSEYYQTHDYKPDLLAKTINPILDDMNLENADAAYTTEDGRPFFMGYLPDRCRDNG